MLTAPWGNSFGYRLPSTGQRIARGDRGKENGTMTAQQKALMAELRAADYPATWRLSASAADRKLAASAHPVPNVSARLA
jgi:hypothetical protein